MTSKKSRIITILTCIIGDATFFYWVFITFSKKERFNQLLSQSLSLHQMTLSDVNESDILQLYSIMINSLFTAIALIAIFHLFVYFLFYAQKKASIRYVKFVSWVALLTSPFLAFSISEPRWLQVLLVCLMLPYLWVILEFRKQALKT